MQLREYTASDELAKIKGLYEAAFPAVERKPFSLMRAALGKGVEMLGIEADGRFVGLAIMLLSDTVALLDYFAVLPDCRGGGIGSAALALLRARYPERPLLVEIEDPDALSDNPAERLRRKAFYLRNGMREMPYRVLFYGTEMQVLTLGGTVTPDRHLAVYRTVLGEETAKHICPL